MTINSSSRLVKFIIAAITVLFLSETNAYIIQRPSVLRTRTALASGDKGVEKLTVQPIKKITGEVGK